MKIKDGVLDLRTRCARPKCNKVIRQTAQARDMYIRYQPFCSFQCKEFNNLESVVIKD